MKAFYAGSFDPFTIGHFEIAGRTLDLFDELIIGIGVNESKCSEMPVEERIENIKKIFKDDDRVTVLGYAGLTAEVARQHGAGVLVRGVRNTNDFEKEKELADINLEVFGLTTILLPASPALTYISSSMIRELKHFGKDVSEFLPDAME